MALPTLADAKSVLRIEDTSEDTLVTALLARAQAAIERYLGYPLAAVSRAYIDYAETDNYGVNPYLRLPGPFNTSGPAPTVVDVNGTTYPATQYDMDQRAMKIRAKSGYCFPDRPYTVTADIGLSAHPDYAAQLEAIASTAILDFVAELYTHRDPGAAQQADEGGASVSRSSDPIPPRALQSIAMLPGVWLVMA